jgi:Transposase Tn5 dimerisation domain
MRIMQLVYQSRLTPGISCELVLTKEQWVVLYMLIHKKPSASDQPPTLGEAVKWIGKLGGHLGRKSDGPPGLKAVWTGYRRLCDATSTYLIMNKAKFG